MRRLSAVLAAVCLPLVAGAPAGADVPAPSPARVNVVQAVPGATVDVTVDGRPVAGGAGVGEVLGPFELEPGSHEISFRGKGVKVESTLDVGAGDTSDVVLHLPADVGGDPVVHSYVAPAGPIGPGKARVLLAHTATVAPADVEVDGQTVFTNIANGEFADADVPEGSIRVALLPSGADGADPILGPLDVTLEARTLSMIYAYGNPRDGSMNVIAHTVDLAADGSVRPSRIETGSAGLVEGRVTTFNGSTAGRRPGPAPGGRSPRRGAPRGAGRLRRGTAVAPLAPRAADRMSVRTRALMISACLVVATGCAGSTDSTRPDTRSPSAVVRVRPVLHAPSSSSAEPVTPARRAESVVAPRRPVRATLPSGRVVPVSGAGTTGTGVLDVPDDVDVAGWWRGGSRIGDPFGSILVAAHVDSDSEGLGPFAELLTVREGARIRLEAHGLRQDFEVRSRRLVPQGSLVDDAWIYDAAGDLRLTLVTCAPPYDASRGGYQNLAVVTAVPLGPPEAT